MAHREGQSTFNPSTFTPPEKLITPSHPSRSVPQGKKKTVFDAWNVYHFTLITDTILRLLLLGAIIDIAQPLKAALPEVVDTPDDMTKSLLQSPKKQKCG